MCLGFIASCVGKVIGNVVGRFCCFGGGIGTGSFSILECCAMIYCYHKVKTCCAAMVTKISNCLESTKNNIKSCCTSITDVCSDEHSNNNNIDADVMLTGTGQIDSVEEHV